MKNPARDNLGGGGLLWRSLTPSQCRAIAAARASGVPARALAREYGVNIRTIYRVLAYARQPWAVVRVGDWHAEFVVTDGGPVRCTAWMAAP